MDQPVPPTITSLLDHMQEGNEYESIVSLLSTGQNVNFNFVDEVRRCIDAISRLRGKPLVCYIANGVNLKLGAPISIDHTDDLPFSEMIDKIPASVNEIDILLVTTGGSGEQVASFVNKLRPRFEKVSFILPNVAMSAGTMFVMSGDEIIMDERALIGPIDPQVPNREGRFVPAQSILELINEIQERGQKLIDNHSHPLWTDLHIINAIDPKDIGSAISGSNYSIELVSNYLLEYKFKNWEYHSTNGIIVTEDEKRERAQEIAELLCSHRVWKNHSRGITRDIAWQVCKIKIEHSENIDGLNNLLRRFWALLYWTFENSVIYKMFVSNQYCIMRNINPAQLTPPHTI